MRRFSFVLVVVITSLFGCPSTRKPILLEPVLASGEVDALSSARPAFGTIAVRAIGDRLYQLQTARSVEGDYDRRFVVSTFAETLAESERLWSYPAEGTDPGDEFLDDFAVHPSGEVTLTLEHRDAVRDTFEILRFGTDGDLLSRQPLPAVELVPDSDLQELTRAAFVMKSNWNDDALAEGWIRVVASGDDVVVAFQTMLDAPNGEFSLDVASAVSWLRRDADEYTATRTRIVDGRHGVGPAAWAYDEFRWRQAAVRPYLAVDPITDHVVVGRAWSNPRCTYAVEVFQEGTQRDCIFGSVSPVENERVPFGWTSFSSDGTREGTHTWMPDSTSEFVIFDMAVRDGLVALVGSRVHEDAEGNVAYYGGNLVPYDGYVALLDRATGELRLDRNVDASGRGDFLATLRFVDDGVLAGGAADWDRWNGGMSISRGSDPWFAFVSLAGEVVTRVVPVDAPSRHTHLLGVDVHDGAGRTIVGAGLSDAPMTHSGDGGQVGEMVFGDEVVTLGRR